MADNNTEIDNMDGDDFECDDEDMEMMDPMEALANFLSTEDGETIATSLASLKDATQSIAKHMEKQNLILIKILTALTAKPAPAPEAQA
jgi:hypothetical protein